MSSNSETVSINKPTSLFNRLTLKKFVIDKKENLKELPFGWGDGEPPTPDEEYENLEAQKNNQIQIKY
jgi:hypothetical protein